MASERPFNVKSYNAEFVDTVMALEAGGLVERAFSFGMGQVDPRTGRLLRNGYVLIVAPDKSMHRFIMLALFGQGWCAEYASEQSLIEACGPESWRYAYVRFDGPVGAPWQRPVVSTVEGTAEPSS